MKSDRKPPLPKSPILLRPRRVLRSNSSSLQNPPGSLTKPERPNRFWDNGESVLRPEYRSISCDLRDLARMVRDEFGKGVSDDAGISNSLSADSSSLFERGRFYEEYSARRNERLRRKKSDTGVEKKTPYNLGVSVESAKRMSSTKKFESLRKSVSAAYTVEKSETPTPRYMLRSTMKENKKPPRPLPATSGKSTVLLGARPKAVVRRVRRD
ncbi:hypothetical protein I3760_07G137500 [Carya illinoinensis]|uniref:Uncharacterized protein n=1 Tax=Carya illinoinensis TaxID=32201 RepID=A0A8T1PUV3_CARIL|nr:uncharacterized protein LOC122316029 [Carya illinoinensis]KAG2698174.1 hypothetical protein I3760_07G137500 [Carya illinoinensis]KAG6648319.1 hypothetical protein CIPAW_07G138600 [Carya illinoinensis]